MNTIDGLGYFAASLVLATFCAKTMISLRSLAIASNGAFIVYGTSARLWPIVLLHAVMLPLNLFAPARSTGCAIEREQKGPDPASDRLRVSFGEE